MLLRRRRFLFPFPPLPPVVHLERREVHFEQPVLVVEVFDPARDGQGLVVGPVVVLGVDRGLPHVPDRPVQSHHLVVVLSEKKRRNNIHVSISQF